MPSLPTGTVTFLFTDIEGSTKHWEVNPQAMRAAFTRQEAILRQAISGNGGYAYKMIGDAFQAAFPTAPQAMQTAIDAQRALNSESWPSETGGMRVRMALHTGVTEERGDDYVGPSLNRVARLLSAGHGGQVLLTLAAQQLLRDNLPLGVTLRDMGEHRLKDLTQPERVFQVVAPGLTSDFPPLNTLDARPNNLPIERSPLVGRGAELQSVCQLLMRAQVGLLTLTGPGGIGKTRLALQVAAEMISEFWDGAFFVSLSNTTDPALVPTAIVQTLGVRQAGSGEMVDSLADYLSDKQLLLLLDNFEQVVTAAPLVARLLAVAPRLKVLATSREVLRVRDEQEFAVPPLGVPDPSLFKGFAPSPGALRASASGQALGRLPSVEIFARYEAVVLFVQRARLVNADFQLTGENAAAVAEICYRLDGLPLAIELAAARIRMLTPQAILDRLQSRFKLLTGGARDLPARQQTLRGAIEWSYDLLQPGEQRLLRRMSVFEGGATLEAIEAVCNADGALELDVFDGVSSLVDKSLVRQETGIPTGSPASIQGSLQGVEPQREMRFGMLQSIREFAMELLQGPEPALSAEKGLPLGTEPSEEEEIYQRRAEYFLALAEQSSVGLQGHQQEMWMQRLEVEQAHLVSVMKRAVEQQRGETAMRLGAAMWMFWGLREYNSEGIKWLKEAFGIPGAEVLNMARALALRVAGGASMNQGDLVTARAYSEESLAIIRQLGPEERHELGFGLVIHGYTLAFTGEPKAGRAAVEESLSLLRQAENRWGLSMAEFVLGVLTTFQGDQASAERAFERSIALSREVGNTWTLSQALNGLGDVLRILGDYARAKEEYEEGLVLVRRLNGRNEIPALLHNLGHVALAQGEVEDARKHFIEALHLQVTQRNRVGIAECLAGLGGVAGAEAHPERAARLFGASEALRAAGGAPALYPAERADYERNVASAREQVDSMPGKEAAWEKAWQEGRAMSLEAAVEYALEES